MPPGSLNSGPASQPSSSPPTNVLHVFLIGSSSLILLLYVSATYSLPPWYATPSACCSRTSRPSPSWSPNSNSPCPTSVRTSPRPVSGTARTALVSLSATYSVLPSEHSPDGCANSDCSDS